jgi:hypothetical protein
MTRLHDAFDVLVNRGEPAGADIVFARARDALMNGTVSELQPAVTPPRAWFRIVVVAGMCVAVVVAAAVALTSRGGTNRTTVPAPLTRPSEAGLRSAATAYANAFLTGSYRDLIVVLDPNCAPKGVTRSSSQLASGNSALQRFRLALKRQTGVNVSDIKIRGVTVRNFIGQAGEAEVQYALPTAVVGNDNWNSYAYSGGRWHIAGCDLKAPIGGVVEGKSAVATTTPTTSCLIRGFSGGACSGPPPSPVPCPAGQTEPSFSGTYCGPEPPPGNGLGPQGECTGRETAPPCGAGVVEGRYYAFTLPGTCDGRVVFDGRLWDSELPPDRRVPDMYVWMRLGSLDSAGFISPRGAVGFRLDTGEPPRACGG